MPYSRLLIAMLLLATVLVDLVAITIAGSDLLGREQTGVNPYLMMLLPLAMSQISLASIWAGLGEKSRPWRLVSTFLLVALWAAVTANFVAKDPRLTAENTLALLTQSLFVLGPLSVLRMLGLRWGDASITDAAASVAADRPPWQFSLRSLFAWTTGLAIVLGTLKWAVRYEFLPSVPNGIMLCILLALFGALPAVVAFVSLWAALGSRWLFGRLISIATILALAAVLPRQFDGTRESAWIITTLFCLPTLLLFGSLLVLRVAGYRLRMVRKKMQVERINSE